MAKEKAIYAPGELDKVRGKLGPLNADEAKRMVQLLGGEVGVERGETPYKAPKVRNKTVEVTTGNRSRGGQKNTSRPAHRSGASQNKPEKKPKRESSKGLDPTDNPAISVKLSYIERVKMDRYMGQAEFEIKNTIQVLQSVLSFFSPCPDYVTYTFVVRKLNEYYKRIETLTTSTRNLFPRNNTERNEQLRRSSPFAYSVLDTIRYWNIERISAELTRVQSRPRSVKTSDLADILRGIYKPLFILDELDSDVHIKESYKLLYKLLYEDSTNDMRNRYQELIRSALGSLTLVRRDVRFLLYPLLVKLLSDRWLPYDRFFVERRNRLMAFLNVTNDNQISAAGVLKVALDNEPGSRTAQEQEEGEESEDEEGKAKHQAIENEKRALDRGLSTLEVLFPKAGWDKLASFPDIYPYFLDVFNFKRDYSLMAPTDPILQVMVLLRILEELLYGLRYVSFGDTVSPDDPSERLEDALSPIINNWHWYIEHSLEKEYLPRLSEYCRILENTIEARNSSYARRLLNELHWAKRLYFLPFYKFESSSPPPFQKNKMTPLYPEIRALRKYLTVVAEGIEQGSKLGGAEKQAPCEGIENPWAPYMFQVPNPVSERLSAILSPKKRNNASLIFFTLAVSSVLDYLVNNEGSWAYSDRPGPLMRGGKDGAPLLPVNSEVNTQAIFDEAMKQREVKTGDVLDPQQNAVQPKRQPAEQAQSALPEEPAAAKQQTAPVEPPKPAAAKQPPASAEPPKPAAAKQSSASAEPPKPAAAKQQTAPVEPPKPAAAKQQTAPVEPPKPAAAKQPSASAEPPKPAAAKQRPPTSPEPQDPAMVKQRPPTSPEPQDPAMVKQRQPASPEPPKPAAAKQPPASAEPPKPAAVKQPPASAEPPKLAAAKQPSASAEPPKPAAAKQE